MAKYYIGVDVGGTKIAAALIMGNKIVKQTKAKTEAKKSSATILNNINSAITEIYNSKVAGIGIGIAGQINRAKGVVVSSPNFSSKFRNVKLRQAVYNKFRKPVKIDNDANCFTLGEAVYGAGKGLGHVIGLTLGTGVGGGIVINKKIYHGTAGLAGELGHVTIVQNGLICSCKQRGHLEAYVSGTAMTNIHKNLTGYSKHPLKIEEAAKAGNQQAKKTFEIMSLHLAEGLANIANIFNPDIIVLGGGLAKVKILTVPAISLHRQKVVYPELAKIKVVRAKLGDAGLIGSILLFK